LPAPRQSALDVGCFTGCFEQNTWEIYRLALSKWRARACPGSSSEPISIVNVTRTGNSIYRQSARCDQRVTNLIRLPTERPQVYDAGLSVNFDPAEPEDSSAAVLRKSKRSMANTSAMRSATATPSERIAIDFQRRNVESGFLRGIGPIAITF